MNIQPPAPVNIKLQTETGESMSKLDEIQKAINGLGNVPQDKISSMEAIGIVLSLLNQIVEELKRIDAEQKSIDKVVTDLSNIHP